MLRSHSLNTTGRQCQAAPTPSHLRRSAGPTPHPSTKQQPRNFPVPYNSRLQCAWHPLGASPSPTRPSKRAILARSSSGPDQPGSDPNNDAADDALQLLVDYATAGTLAAIIGWGTSTPALGTFHPDLLDTARVMLLLSPIYILDIAMMLPDFTTAASLRSLSELEPGAAIIPAGARVQGKHIVFDSWAAYYRFLLDGNQVDCIVNDPCINVPLAPRIVLVALSALSEEMLFRGVLVALLSKGLSLAVLQAGLEGVAPGGPSGTGAVAAALLFASLIALVPVTKVQNALRDIPETKVVVREAEGEATGVGALLKAWTLPVPQRQAAAEASSSSSTGASSSNGDGGSSSGAVGSAADDGVPALLATMGLGRNGTTGTGGTAGAGSTSSTAAGVSVSLQTAGEEVGPSGQAAGVVYQVQAVNPAAVYKGVQGVRNVLEVLLLNLGFVLTGNLAASFAANVTMQVLFSLCQFRGELRMKAQAGG